MRKVNSTSAGITHAQAGGGYLVALARTRLAVVERNGARGVEQGCHASRDVSQAMASHVLRGAHSKVPGLVPPVVHLQVVLGAEGLPE